MRCILGIVFVLVLCHGQTTALVGAEPDYRSADRVRVRLRSSAARQWDEQGTTAAERRDSGGSQWRAPSERLARRDEVPADQDDVQAVEYGDEGWSDEDHELPPVRRNRGGSRVAQAQYTTPQTLSGQVTLEAPTFDPYALNPHSTLYAPAASIVQPLQGGAPPPVVTAPYSVAPPPLYPPGPSWGHRTGIFGEFLYLRPRNAEVPYAVPIDGPVAPILGNAIQVGPTATVDPGFQPAFAAGGAFALTETSSLRAKYSRFEQTTTDSASIDPPDVLRSLVTHPLGANAATDTLDAAASYQLKFDMIDADYAGSLWDNEKYSVSYFGGGRYLQFDQDFNATFTTIGTTTVDTAIQFAGGGIRLGLEGQRRHCPTGLLVFARGASNFVVGQFDSTYTQTDATGVTVVSSSFDAARIVPMLDLELGAGWMSPNGLVRLTAGYMISAWFNMVTTPEYIQAVQANDFDGLSDTLTFDGLTARATVQF